MAGAVNIGRLYVVIYIQSNKNDNLSKVTMYITTKAYYVYTTSTTCIFKS